MSFLRDYLCYAAENEAPKDFHRLAGLMSLSCALGRRAWLPFGKFAIYPNLYVLFVGDAGNGKTITMNYMDMLLKSAFDPLELPMSANVDTPAGLWTTMFGKPKAVPPIQSLMQMVIGPDGKPQESHPMLIKANELVNFISVDPENWTSHLNDIYDQNVFRYRTIASGDNTLFGPYICLVGGVTTEFIQDLQRLRIIGSGFARRTLFQYGEKDFQNPRSRLTETPEQAEAFMRCINHLRAVRKCSGAFTLSEETWLFWDGWYKENSYAVPKRSPQVRSWFTSKPDQVLKLACLFSLSERFDLVVETTHLQLALAQLEVLESTLYRIFGGMGRNDLSDIAHKIFMFVSGLNEPIAKKVLYLKFWQSLPRRRSADHEFDECLTFLVSDGKITQLGVSIGAAIDTLIGTPEVITEFVRRHGGGSKPQ